MNEPLMEAQINALNRVADALESFNDSLPVLKKHITKVEVIQELKANERKRKTEIADCISKIMPDVERVLEKTKKAEGATTPTAKP